MKAKLKLTLTLACAGLSIMSATAQTFTTLYNFSAGSGNLSYATPVVSGNTLYGTTENGPGSLAANGTMFKINTDGSGFTNFITFFASSATNGSHPEAGLILSSNRLYGTTYNADTFHAGVVFGVNTDGTDFTNLYAFNGPNQNGDGAGPLGGLLLSSNTLYGTTYSGGSDNSDGTVFKVNIDGTGYAQLHSFGTSPTNGAQPYAGLAISGNTLYGTTSGGGTYGQGTVFKINTDGTGYTNLLNCSDLSLDGNHYLGYSPEGVLVLSGITLYGTAYLGGSKGGGTVFKLNTDGSGYTNIYNLGGGTDGGAPQAGLVLAGSALYGTTYYGGTHNIGTVFKVNTDGSGYTNIHSFTAYAYNGSSTPTNSDGFEPYGGLALAGNTLYGTTFYGGTNGYGTVFAITLPLPPSPPSLGIAPSGGGVKISWPSAATNYVLQQNSNLATTNWSTNSLAVANDGTNKSVTVIPAAGNAYFRLMNTNSP